MAQSPTHSNRTEQTTASASNIEAHTVQLYSGHDLNITGSNIIADTDLNIHAQQDIRIQAADQQQQQQQFHQTRQSGLLSDAGLAITIGQRRQDLEQYQHHTTAAASTLGAIQGNLSITAGGSYTQIGSDALTPQGNIDISARRVDIMEARETMSHTHTQTFSQSGVSIGINAPIMTMAQGILSTAQAIGQTKSSRMQALGAATLGLQSIALANTMHTLANSQNLAEAANISLNISVGSSRSQHTHTTQQDRARASTLTAGQHLHITATEDDLTIQGSKVYAHGNTSLYAHRDITLRAAEEYQDTQHTQHQQSASIGVNIATAGVSANAQAQWGQGQGTGHDIQYRNTKVSGQQVSLISGRDTLLKGALVQGKQVSAHIGRHLEIISLQDSSQYNENSQSAGFNASIPITGGSFSASVNASKTTIHSDYRSVNEQSAIRAGDGGFDINVQGTTTLIGGQITSTDHAVQQQRNTFKTQDLSLTDLDNHATFKGDSLRVTLGTQGGSAGIAHDDGASSSHTTSAISSIAGHTTARTGDTQEGITPIFNPDILNHALAAQTQITADFGQHASKAVGDYAEQQLAHAQQHSDPAEIAAWQEGGYRRVALHTLVGGLTGGIQGALGAGISQSAIPYLGDHLRLTDLPDPLKQSLILAAGTAIGAVTGNTAGATTALNATANNYLYSYQGRIIARDQQDNDKIINLSTYDLEKLAAQNPEILMQIIAGINTSDAPIRVTNSSAAFMTRSSIQDLNNPQDRANIAKESDMGYLNINGHARVFVQTGMDNTRQDATISAQTLSKLLGGIPTGYINNGTEGIVGDVGEYLPNTLSKKDILNEYTYRTLNQQGPSLILLHSAGNEDNRKALQAGALYGHQYPNLSFISLGSPVSKEVLRQNITAAGATFLGQLNDWKDPVTYSKTAATVSITSFLAGIGAGIATGTAAYGAMTGALAGSAAGPLGTISGTITGAGVVLAGAGVGAGIGGIPGILGGYGLKNYHPFQEYIHKPQAQSIMFDWLNRYPQSK